MILPHALQMYLLSLLYTLVKLAKSHYLLLSFVCILYIVFVCIFNFLLPLVVNKDVHLFNSFCGTVYAVAFFKVVQQQTIGM